MDFEKELSDTINQPFVFTEDQKKAIELIEDFLSNSKEKFFLLKGYAGTGKSFLINHVLYKHHLEGKSIAVSSFTNKATNVISKMTPFATGISLFRLLGLKTEEDSEQLNFEFKGKDKLGQFDVIVVDEISMLSDECFVLLKERSSKRRGIKIILMGDPAQLPPIQESSKNTIAFDEKNYTPETFFELKEIVRQSKNSNIPKYSFYIRNILDKISEQEKRKEKNDKIDNEIEIPISLRLPLGKQHKYINDNNTNCNDNIFNNNNGEYKENELVEKTESSDIILFDDAKKFMEVVLEYFSSKDYSQNSDFAKVVAYRNIVIDSINAQIRNRMFFSGKTEKHNLELYSKVRIRTGASYKDVCAIVEGENLILNSPAASLSNEIPGNTYDTSDELIVTGIFDYSLFKRNMLGLDINFPYYVLYTKRKYDGEIATLNVVNPLYKVKFENMMELLAKKISELPEAKHIFKTAFYPMKKLYHTVGYNYAITAYKGQGSTYSNVFVIEDDLDQIKKASIKTLWQAKYTIFTRVSKKLFILNRNNNRKRYEEVICQQEYP